jgi:hypothetical protein
MRERKKKKEKSIQQSIFSMFNKESSDFVDASVYVASFSVASGYV